MNFDTKDFEDFLKYFSRRKNNLLRQSNATPIKRNQIVTLDLSSASVSSDNTSNLWKIPTNFTGIHLEKIYDKTTLTREVGEIYLVLDDSNLGNVANSKLLQPGDTFNINEGEIANAWLYWDAQGNNAARIAFLIDVDYRAGTTEAEIIGDVSVFTSPGEYVSEGPTAPYLTTNLNCSGVGGSGSYVVPAGKVARISYMLWAATGAATVNIQPPSGTSRIIGVAPFASSYIAAQGIIVAPGGTITVATSAAGAEADVYIELYNY